jgi:hypothetical protein
LIVAHKKEENRVEEQREKVKSLQYEYEENMRGINEKLESKSYSKKIEILYPFFKSKLYDCQEL